MRKINNNLGRLKLLMVKGPCRSVLDSYLIEKEYYASDDDQWLGTVVFDDVDKNFSVALLRRDASQRYRLVDQELDIPTIDDARKMIQRLKDAHQSDSPLEAKSVPQDLFNPIVVKQEELHPYFSLLKDNEFYLAAKRVIQEMYYYFDDLDNNFKDQFQSRNGFDARIWELYLRIWLKEEGFNIINDVAAPDFLIERLGDRVAIEAVTVQRRQKDFGNMPPAYTGEELKAKLDNETPLMFGSSLYSKLKHTYNGTNYWNLPHTHGLPFCIAIADFQEDMSMTWSYPAVVSILYGIEQEIREEDGDRILYTINGKTFIKDTNGKKVEITPLFLDRAFENISAVIFSASGTLSKFNRIGRMCGLGPDNYAMIAFKTLYNHDRNATVCDFAMEIIDERYSERWSEGINIFHNPFAKHKLDPSLFPNVAHHFYKDGLLHSIMPETAPFSILTYNVKNGSAEGPNLIAKFEGNFDKHARQWNLRQ